jgi:hypothetical protein
MWLGMGIQGPPYLLYKLPKLLQEGSNNKMKTKIFVNLEKGEITIIQITKIPIFKHSNVQWIEGDEGGFSVIEKRYDGYYLKNYLREQNGCKVIEEVKLDERKVKGLLKDIVIKKFA